MHATGYYRDECGRYIGVTLAKLNQAGDVDALMGLTGASAGRLELVRDDGVGYRAAQVYARMLAGVR